MDENLVLHAIQWLQHEGFEERYTIFDSEGERNNAYYHMASEWDPEVVKRISKVTLTVRVETVIE